MKNPGEGGLQFGRLECFLARPTGPLLHPRSLGALLYSLRVRYCGRE
jgi:hypothetical protein